MFMVAVGFDLKLMYACQENKIDPELLWHYNTNIAVLEMKVELKGRK